MTYKHWLLSILGVFILSSCAAQQQMPADVFSPSGVLWNAIPMYGYPEYERPERLKKTDQELITTAVSAAGSREKASRLASQEGWRQLVANKPDVAMRRFNQAWLLDPENYSLYWGFAAVLSAQDKESKALVFYEKALALIDEEQRKPTLLLNLAQTYSLEGARALDQADKSMAKVFFEKANQRFGESVRLRPGYGRAYRAWAESLFVEEDYAKSWAMVKVLRQLGEPGELESLKPFLQELSRQMPEPQ